MMRVALLLLLAAGVARAELDLNNAERHVLANGLAVLLLEDRSFPVVSVQAVYRVGARNELPGKTGLAHFVEHMAFRGSEHFPDTGLVSRIYAVGGEWHGYTWIDQTTYFATVPAGHLGLLLEIEADRMARLRIEPDDVSAEQGAVLAEMQGYENDPAAVLFDATLFAAFVAHPYRNNTIGFASDIRGVTHADVVDFYRAHYHPGNAVLAIVGDIDPAATLDTVRKVFGDLPGRKPTPLPVAVEPPQQGERRVQVLLPAERQHFQLAWQAPAAADPDFPAFLLLQALAGGSGGVNFLHNEFGTPVAPGTRLAGIADDLATWLIPTAQPYVFLVKGSIAADADRAALEAAVDAALAPLAENEVGGARLAAARAALHERLVLDLQTTEDAAHQLAYYTGIDALDTLLTLPARIDAVTPADVQQVARRWLGRERRTVGWLVDGAAAPRPPAIESVAADPRPAAPVQREPAPPPRLARLDNGLPVIFQPSPLSPTAHLAVVLRGAWRGTAGRLGSDESLTGTSTWRDTVPTARLADAIDSAASALASAERPAAETVPARDPYRRFEQVVARLGPRPAATAAVPAVIVVAGRYDEAATLARLQRAFGKLPFNEAAPAAAAAMGGTGPVREHIDVDLAQARTGYVVAAPAPREPAADAWQALLYILSHDYEGRLGKAAISDRGLVYYIDARYRSDGGPALVTLSAGVDPAKQDSFGELLAAELARLEREPPSDAEVAEALAHRLGRAQSAAQSNAELATSLATDWLWYGAPQSVDDLAARLASVTPADVRAAVKAFTAGRTVTISVE